MRSRAALRGCRALAGFAAMLIVAGAVAAQEETRQLTVTVAVCPAGARDPSPERCATRVARAFDVTVLDAADPLAEDVAAGAAGRARAPLPAAPEGELQLQVIVNTAVEVGSRAVACEAGGRPVAAELESGAAAIPVFSVAAPAEEDVACVVYLFGFPEDAAVLDIIPSPGTPMAIAATPAATPVDEDRTGQTSPTKRGTPDAGND